MEVQYTEYKPKNARAHIKKGRKGLEKLKDAGKSLAKDIEHQLQEFSDNEEHIF